MKNILALTLVAAAAMPAAAEAPLWLRDAAISPDGKTVAFTFKGDIFTVPVAGGDARQLTSSKGHDSAPVWTPDGSRIAFASDRLGSEDIFIIDSRGGNARRLTTSSSGETPLAFINDSTLLFSANDMPARGSAQAPFLGQTFTVNVDRPAQRPVMFLSMPMRSASVNKDGDILYTDRKGYEDYFRKHERSSGTNDVWLYDDGAFRQLTTFNGHDMDPVWGPAPGSYYYISEADGTLNVYAASLNGGAPKQLTTFTKHPVRSLSASTDGTLAFSWDGELYTLRPGQQPQKINVAIHTDDFDADYVKYYTGNGASNFAVSPSGDEVAFVIRGDIYATSTKYKTTRRITDTPAQERSLDFSPDGRSIVYDSDRDGYWQLFIAKLSNPDDKTFTYASDIVEEPLYKCDTSAQQPLFSPDGKKVAFLENRTELKVIDLASKQVTTALDGKYNYSYTDGDVSFEWSPDSKWLLVDYIGVGGWNNKDIALVKADGTEVVDLTESGYSNDTPKWALGGEAVTFSTAKYGMKSHGSWGNQSDIMLMALTPGAWDRLNYTDEEAALAKKAEEDADKDKDADKKGDKKKKGKKEEAKDAAKTIDFDLGGRRYRTKRLTDTSAIIGDYWLSPDGDKLYYVAGSTEGDYNLYCRNLRDDETSVLVPGLMGGILTDKEGKNIFMLTYTGGMKKIDLESGKPEDIEFEALYDRHPSLEREYIYDHMLRQVNDKFYDPKLHGVDWKGYGEHYRRFLPYIDNDRDFANLLSEILGELNASHTGGRAGYGGVSMPTASLGAYFDDSYTGEGLKVTEVIPRGPLATKEAGIMAGDIILAIDGDTIAPGADFNPMLEGKAGKKTTLRVKKADGTTRDVKVRPISRGYAGELAYQRWVEHNEHVVDSLSGGKVGYVHIQGMDAPSFNVAYDRILGKYRNCDAVIVDTRYNGGGWLHNDIALLLSGREYVRFTPRGRYIGSEPFSQWCKPSVMLVNESNYSDAHGTPYTYQTLGIGDVVGAPVPGTMTAVWWENQINPNIIFGIPQVTSSDLNGNALENKQLNPDVLIYNAPVDVLRGTDAQLEGAVRHLLKKTSKGQE